MQQDSNNEESWVEEELYREVSAQADEGEREFIKQRDASFTSVYDAFQESATSVAQLYRERTSVTFPDTGALWLPFQAAAGTVTSLYKESCDGIKRSSEAALQCGYQRRTRDLMEWACSRKRRMIRREDLLAYLANKPMLLPGANNHHHHYAHYHQHSQQQHRHYHHANRRSPKPEHQGINQICGIVGNGASGVENVVAGLPHNHHQQHQALGHCQLTSVTSGAGENAVGDSCVTDPAQQQIALQQQQQSDLNTFKEALVLRPKGPELFAFVANEIARHCNKRPGSPADDKMDVCHFASKRQRFM